MNKKTRYIVFYLIHIILGPVYFFIYALSPIVNISPYLNNMYPRFSPFFDSLICIFCVFIITLMVLNTIVALFTVRILKLNKGKFYKSKIAANLLTSSLAAFLGFLIFFFLIFGVLLG